MTQRLGLAEINLVMEQLYAKALRMGRHDIVLAFDALLPRRAACLADPRQLPPGADPEDEAIRQTTAALADVMATLASPHPFPPAHEETESHA